MTKSIYPVLCIMFGLLLANCRGTTKLPAPATSPADPVATAPAVIDTGYIYDGPEVYKFLYGTWLAAGPAPYTSLDFTEKETVRFNGSPQQFKFTVEPNYILVERPDSIERYFILRVNAGMLKLQHDSETFIYNKMAAHLSAPPSMPITDTLH